MSIRKNMIQFQEKRGKENAMCGERRGGVDVAMVARWKFVTFSYRNKFYFWEHRRIDIMTTFHFEIIVCDPFRLTVEEYLWSYFFEKSISLEERLEIKSMVL